MYRMFTMNLMVFPILYTFHYEAESRKDLFVLFSPLGSLKLGVLAIGSWGAPWSIPQYQQRYFTSLLGSWSISLPSNILNPFRSFVFSILHSLPPTKALSNHLLRPAQFIIYTTPLLPMLLKGRLDFESGDRKVRRCSIVVWPQNESLNENQTFHSINIKSLLVNFIIWPYAKSPYHLFSRLIMCQLPRRYLCLTKKL